MKRYETVITMRHWNTDREMKDFKFTIERYELVKKKLGVVNFGEPDCEFVRGKCVEEEVRHVGGESEKSAMQALLKNWNIYIDHDQFDKQVSCVHVWNPPRDLMHRCKKCDYESAVDAGCWSGEKPGQQKYEVVKVKRKKS